MVPKIYTPKLNHNHCKCYEQLDSVTLFEKFVKARYVENDRYEG